MKYKRKKDGIFLDQKTGRMMEHRGYVKRIYWNRDMLDRLRRDYPTTLNDELAGCLGVSPSTMHRKVRELGLKKDPDWLARVWEERRRWAQVEKRRLGHPGCFRKGERRSQATEFKAGHILTPEQLQKRSQSMRRWYLLNPEKAKAKALKAAATRRARINNNI